MSRLRRAVVTPALALAALSAAGGLTAASATAATAEQCDRIPQYVVSVQSATLRTDPGGAGSTIATLYTGHKINSRGDGGYASWLFGYAEGVGYGWTLKSGLTYNGQVTVCH